MKRIIVVFATVISLAVILSGCSDTKTEQPVQGSSNTETMPSNPSVPEEESQESLKAEYTTVIPFGDNIDSSIDPSEREGNECIIIEPEFAEPGQYTNDSVTGINKLLGLNVFTYKDYTVITTDDFSVDSLDRIIRELSEEDVTTFIFDLGKLEDFKDTRDELAQRFPNLLILPKIASEEEHKENEIDDIRSTIQGQWSYFAAGTNMNIEDSMLTITIGSTGPGAKVMKEDSYEYTIEKVTDSDKTCFIIRMVGDTPYVSELYFYPSDSNHLYGNEPTTGEEMQLWYR